MKTTIKGFVEIAALIDNTKGQVSSMGELSDKSLTYSTDKQEYSLSAFPGYDLTSFFCQADGTRAVAPAIAIEKIIGVTKELYDNFDGVSNAADFIKGAFPGLTDVATGRTISKGDKNLVESFSASFSDGGDTVEIHIYLSDQTFQAYDQNETRVVGPIGDINNLYGANLETVSGLINSETMMSASHREELVRNNDSYTKRDVYELKWTDPANSAATISTYWVILGFGPTATTTEKILEAIRDYLTTKTDKTIQEWKRYFPDVISTENFLLMPFWDETAITAGGGIASIYSPITDVSEVPTFIRTFVPSATIEDVLSSAEVTTHIYNGIRMAILPGDGNTPEKSTFKKAYDDYAVLDINDQNLRLISARTRAAITAIELLLTKAETYNQGDAGLPTGISEFSQEGSVYLESTLEGVALRVLTRASHDLKI